MFATSLALLSQEFQSRERGTAFGIWGATVGAAVAIGPLAGGVLTATLGWRWIFFVNLPVGAAALALSAARLRESSDPEHSRLDPPGLVTFSGGVFLLIFALVRGNALGWQSGWILACLVGGSALLVAFLLVEARRERSMFDLTLFRKPAFVGAQLVAFTISAGIFAMFLYLTLYLQNVLGYSPLQAGLRFLPVSVVSFVAAPVAGKLSAHAPPRVLLGVGLGLVALGLLLMHGVDRNSSWLHLLPGFLVSGAGIGMTNPVLASTAIGVVRTERAGMASGINTTFRQVGIATGIAGLGAVFEHHVQTRVADAAARAGASATQSGRIGRAAASGRVEEALRALPAGARRAVAEAAQVAFVGGLNELFAIGAVVSAAGALLAFALVRRRDFVRPGGAG